MAQLRPLVFKLILILGYCGGIFFLPVTSSLAQEQEGSDSIVLVSDLDDTIKISDVALNNFFDFFEVIRNTLFRQRAFTGMAELYMGMLEDKSEASFHVLSSSPTQMRKPIRDFLSRYGFPEGEVILRDWIRERDSVKYKSKSVREIAAETAAPMILIGDDVEHDPDIYLDFSRAQPERTLAIYIHRVSGKEPEGVYGFTTAYDIAYREASEGRLSHEAAEKVGFLILTESRMDRILPDFKECPVNAEQVEVLNSLDLLYNAVNRKIEKYCRKRLSN